MSGRFLIISLLLCLAGALAGCGSPPAETPRVVGVTASLPETAVTAIPTLPPTATEPLTQTATEAVTATPSPTPSRTPEPTVTPQPSDTPTAQPSSTATLVRLLALQNPPLEGEDVLRVQERLLDLGYAKAGWGDGIFSAQTEAAVRRFQYLNHLEMSGVVDAATRQVLFDAQAVSPGLPPPFPGRVLRQDEPLNDDQALHARLAALKFLAGDAEDWRYARFGAETRAAVLAFQQANGLERTGRVDYETWSALFSPWAIPAEGEPNYPILAADAWGSSIYPLSGEPFDLAFDGEKLWVALSGVEDYGNFIAPVDPAAGARAVGTTIRLDSPSPELDSSLGGMLFAKNRLWLLFPNEYGSAAPYLRVLYTQSGTLDAPLQVAACPEGYCFPSSAFGFDGDWLWVSLSNRVYGIRPSDVKVMTSYEIGWLARGKMVFDGSCMWMAGEAGLTAFNAVGMVSCPAASEAYVLPSQAWAFDGKRLWAAGWDLLMWLDVKTGELSEPLSAGYDIQALAFDGKRLWIADAAMDTVTALDVNSGVLGAPIRVGGSPAALLFDGKGLWVACAGSRTVQYLDISDYVIPTPTPSAAPTITATAKPTGQPSATGTPSATRSPTLMATATQPPLARNLYLTSPRLQGDDVLLLQQRLAQLGYTQVGTPDGIFGPLTEAAVRQFQELNGLAVDGVVGPQTWARIFSPDAKIP